MDKRIEEIIYNSHKKDIDRKNINIDNAIKIIKSKNNFEMSEIIIKLSTLNEKEISYLYKIIKGLK